MDKSKVPHFFGPQCSIYWSALQAQRELGVLLTEPAQRDKDRAIVMFTKAAEQQVLKIEFLLLP